MYRGEDNACRVLGEKPDGKGQFGRQGTEGRIWLKWISKKWDGRAWSGLLWLTVVISVMNIQVLYNVGNLLTGRGAVGITESILLHVVQSVRQRTQINSAIYSFIYWQGGSLTMHINSTTW